jgi:hypothetical protein
MPTHETPRILNRGSTCATQVEPLPDPVGNGGGSVCVDGVACSTDQPATVTPYPPSEQGTVAGSGVHDVSVDVSRDQEGNE